ncbi:MAG: hypothetical protein PHT33_05575 [bacterium]|nr:hypothetical protein [bacterium]
MRRCYKLISDTIALDHYADCLGLDGTVAALERLAQAVSQDSGWSAVESAALLLHSGRCPLLAVTGSFNRESAAWMEAQAGSLESACSHLKYVDYAQAERDCIVLSEKMIDAFGRKEIKSFRYTALPRGGYIVLAMLSYALNLAPEQLTVSDDPAVPLVVVDDCSLTGIRFRQSIRNYAAGKIIFAHLYSHPALRNTVAGMEERVEACLSAADLTDWTDRADATETDVPEEVWLRRLGGMAYTVRKTDHVCFAWNEPDRMCWDSARERIIPAWHILPMEFCLKNMHMAVPAATSPVRICNLESRAEIAA